MADDLTINLTEAMALLTRTRCMVGATDWQNPDQVAATAEGVDDCLSVAMAWLDRLAVEVGCADEVRQRVEAARRDMMAQIALHQRAGRA